MLPFQAAPLMEQLGSAGVDTTFFGADSFEAAGGYVTDGVDGFYATTHVVSEPDSRVAVLDASFAAATGSPFENPSFAALAADAILVVLAAAEAAGAMDGESIGAAIPDVSVEGITGLISYDGGAIPTKPVYITLMVDGTPTLAAEAS
jgi:branched-chain amino acid transport system substrate-binding protein